MIEMKSFTEADWSAWAGCEGTDPKIGEVKIVTDKEVEALVIADATSVQIYTQDEDGDPDVWLVLPVVSQKMADVVASSLHDGITQLELINDYNFGWQDM